MEFSSRDGTWRIPSACSSLESGQESGVCVLFRINEVTTDMPLIYAFVARGTTVLAEHTGHSGNFATVAAEVRRVNSALLPPFCDVYARVGFFCFPRAVNARPWGHETGPIAAHSPPVAFTRDV